MACALGAIALPFDPSDEAGATAEENLNSQGYCAKHFRTDSSWESQSEAFKQVLEWSGNQLDIVVTSPGIVTNNLMMSILPKNQPEDSPSKPPTKVLEIDLLGVYYSASLALFYFNKLWAERRNLMFRPQLVFICSMAGVSVSHDL